MIGVGQSATYVPDDNFEQYLASIGLDGTGAIDDIVITSNINTVTFLSISNKGISDLTGIQDFAALNLLWCDNNLLTTLDVSDNLYLDELYCNNNQLTSLNVSSNMSLDRLDCYTNQLTSLNVNNCPNLEILSCYQNQIDNLDVSNNTQLTFLNCFGNNLSSLDLSNNTNISSIDCRNNQLNSLNLHNIIWSGLSAFISTGNASLFCIDVDDPTTASSYLTAANGNIDAWSTFSVNCSATYLDENNVIKNDLIKITDVFGRETKVENNQPLFYLYNDGTIEKRIVIE